MQVTQALNKDTFFSAVKCDRCRSDLRIRTLSWFVEQTICEGCSRKEDEIKASLTALGHDPSLFEGCGYMPDLAKVIVPEQPVIKETTVSTPIKQKEAVYSAVTSVLAEHKIPFFPHDTVVKNLIGGREDAKALKAQIVIIVFHGLFDGTVEIKRKPDTEPKLRSYTIGLVDNWLKKDDRLNGTPAKEPKAKVAKAAKAPKEKKAKVPKAPKPVFTDDQNQVQFNDDQNAVDPAAEDGPAEIFGVPVDEIHAAMDERAAEVAAEIGITAEELADAAEVEAGASVIDVLANRGKKAAKKPRNRKKK